MRTDRSGGRAVGRLVRRALSARPPVRLTALLAVACTPVTTRPGFMPYPQAQVSIIDAPATRLVPEMVGWLSSQGLQVQWSSPDDGYVETAWYNVRTHASVFGDAEPADLLNTVKLRCWADPNVPGKSQLTVEVVYRPTLDPSRPERDLEVIAPHGSDGDQIASQLADAMKKRFGE